jgi:opacity protein-like surface antigen
MFEKSKSALLGVLLLAGISAPAAAADLYEPQVVPAPVVQPIEVGGWYIRGDIDYHWSKMGHTQYITYGCPGGGGACSGPGTDDFDTTRLKGAWSLGGGVGYNVNRYFRTDLTVDYWGKADFRGTSSGTCGGVPCSSADKSACSAWLLMANAYANLGTYHGITPYIGAGIGGARVNWDDLENAISGGPTNRHKGTSSWRFAYALMAGASYCLTHNVDVDLGYRFTHITSGRMFEEYAPDGTDIGVGPGFDGGMNVHEVRLGLRYNFGGNNGDGCGEQVAYEPAPAPVYK